ncbi:purine permease 6 [Actinidia rufa]|uniref:Purine permease 6 n=1 Tax=Actinidia rufa TaxID=165716 RepID=A0A7J0DJC0_9ERIC|nr:purine permease 6 [Actinidia rufa]
MNIYPSLVATCVILVGLFASSEWRDLKKEVGDVELGKVLRLCNLGLPIVPVLAVFIFHDKVDGVRQLPWF